MDKKYSIDYIENIVIDYNGIKYPFKKLAFIGNDSDDFYKCVYCDTFIKNLNNSLKQHRLTKKHYINEAMKMNLYSS